MEVEDETINVQEEDALIWLVKNKRIKIKKMICIININE